MKFSKINSEAFRKEKNNSKRFNLAVKKYLKRELKKGNKSHFKYINRSINHVNNLLKGNKI